jgi:hypothetical protein
MRDLRSSWYNAVGAVALPGLAGPNLEDLDREFERVVPEPSNGRLHRPFVRSAISRLPSFAEVLQRSRVQADLEAMIGREVVPVCGDATRYIGETFWHADVKIWTIPMVKLAVYLDPVGDSDSFLYLPCSHNFSPDWREPDILGGFLKGWADEDSPVQQIRFQAGDGIAFDPRLAHAVASTRMRRQVAAIFVAKPSTADEQEEMLRLILMDGTIA